jgi:hypothetical protein
VKPVFVTTSWSVDVHNTTAEGASTERRCAPPGRKTIRWAPEDPDASATDASAESNPVLEDSSKEDPLHEGGSVKQTVGEQGRGAPVVQPVGCALVERDRGPW